MIATIAGIWLLGSALLWTAKKLEDHPAPFWIVIAFWPVLLVAFIGFVLWEVVRPLPSREQMDPYDYPKTPNDEDRDVTG